MTTLKQLLDHYCSENVQYVQLGEVVSYEQPTKYLVKSTDYDDAFETPVLTPGKTFLLGYTDETNGIYEASPAEPVIIFDDFTTANKWVDFPFKSKSSAIKILTPKNESISLRFAFLAMQDLEVDTTDHKRQWIRTFSKELIPFPPREVQDKIVEILDTFAALCENLDTEITQREQQLAAYREKLLSVDYLTHQHCPDGVKYERLGNVVAIRNGSDWKTQEPGDIAVYGSGGKMEAQVKVAASMEPSVLLPRKGSLEVQFVESPFWNIDTVFRTETDPSHLAMKYFYYCMEEVDLSEISTSATRPSLTQTALKRLVLPLPPRDVQDEIIAKLDAMQELIDNLRLEREQRQQQFDYYREKLLSFPQKETAEV